MRQTSEPSRQLSRAAHAKADEAGVAIIETMLRLNRNGIPENVIARAALIAAVDVLAGDVEQDVLPPRLLEQLVAYRLQQREIRH